MKKVMVWITSLVFLALFSCALGTIVWFLWGEVVPVVFPRLVEDRWIAGDIRWTTAVFLVWIMALVLGNKLKD